MPRRTRTGLRTLRALRALFVFLLLPIAAPTPAGAQELALSFNYAFANQLGSGIYRVNGRTVQIYRITGTIPLVDPHENSYGVALRIPGTVGFYDFRIEDVLDKGLPDDLATFTLVPSLEVQRQQRDNWWLVPFVGAGFGRDFSGGETSLIFEGGVRSLSFFAWGPRTIAVGNRLVYSWSTSESLDFRDDFGALENGVDVRRELGVKLWGHELEVGVFGVSYLYLVSPHIVKPEVRALEMRSEWEVGTTLGTLPKHRVLGFGLPRLGVSYRFGTGVDALRIVIGSPFVLNSPDEPGRDIE